MGLKNIQHILREANIFEENLRCAEKKHSIFQGVKRLK